ncbi:uncharacterized protein [Argopecten irradians]|uniref:uncharacterized protein n=1 Tax=Argopecten irradians TaxID=31199 RepID=UPI003715965D
MDRPAFLTALYRIFVADRNRFFRSRRSKMATVGEQTSVVSNHTKDKATKAKVTLENYYSNLLSQNEERENRYRLLEQSMEKEGLSDEQVGVLSLCPFSENNKESLYSVPMKAWGNANTTGASKIIGTDCRSHALGHFSNDKTLHIDRASLHIDYIAV